MTKDDDKPVLTRQNRLELLSLEECEKILVNLLADKQQHGILKHFEIVPATENVGFLGEYYHLILKYQLADEQEEQTTRLFVKSVVFQNANMKFYMEKIGLIQKEIKLYELLLNELKKFSPHVWCTKCYFTRNDLFVMQNVEDMGYVALPAGTRFLSEDQLGPILKTLATLHASSVAYERERGQTIGIQLREWLTEISVYPDCEWYTTGLKAVLAVAATHPDVRNDVQAQEYVTKELPRRLDSVYFMVDPSPVHRNVFVHRDAWGANVFYHKDRPLEERSLLVDFQLCRYAPPAMDFHLVSYLNLEPANRKEMNGRLVNLYYETLAEELQTMGIDPSEEQLSRAEFDQSLKDFALFGVIYNCIAATIIRLPDNYLKGLKDQRPADFHRFCNVDRTPDVLQLMNDHQDFGDYMYACVGDLLALTYHKKRN